MRPALHHGSASLLAGLSVVFSVGCDVTIKDGDVSVRHLRGRASQDWVRKYPLERSGTFQITNNSGAIEIVAGEAGTVEVAAALSASAMTDERAAELIRGAKIDEAASADRVAIVAGPGGRGRDVDVSFKVRVPPDAQVEATLNNDRLKIDGMRGHVKAMVVNGSAELTGLRGTVDAAVVNGPVSVKMAEVTGRVRVEGTNGRVVLEVPKDAKATLNARAVNGGLSVTGLNAPEPVEGGSRRIRSVEAPLNGGGPEIEVRITNGRISIEGK